MAKQNLIFLYGRVTKAPIISKDGETGEYNYGMLYVDVVRGLRSVGDDLKFVKHDRPLVMSREREIIDAMIGWKENDIVFIKGVVTSTKVPKSSYCPNCTDEDGNAVKNSTFGNLLYITPVFAEKAKSFDNKAEAVEDIVNHREISNQVYVYGTLLRDPKIITTAKKIQITQYPIAINRKFTIRTDDPSIKTDWPIVKSYGEQARDDKTFLKTGAEIIIDGFLQARTVTRKAVCKHCNSIYPWSDHAMEIVPYAVEYVNGFYTKEEVEAETQHTVEEYKQMLFNTGMKDELSEELQSDDLKE